MKMIEMRMFKGMSEHTKRDMNMKKVFSYKVGVAPCKTR